MEGKVLIVEDNAETRRVLEKTLQGRAARVLQCAGPLAAVEALEKERPELVLLDLEFPGRFKGSEAVSLVRAAARKVRLNLRLYIVSGVYWRFDEVTALFRAGADGFFSKPFEAAALREAAALAWAERTENGAAGVVVVSRDEGVRRGLAAGLREQGLAVHATGFASVGLALARKHSPRVVVLDLDVEPDLRGMEGLDVLRVLKAVRRTHGTLAAVVSGRSIPGLEREALEAGASFFYPKGAHDWGAVGVQLRRGADSALVDCGGSLCLGRVLAVLKGRKASVDGADAGLTPKEFDLLVFLMKNSPRVVRWEELQRGMWGWEGARLAPKQSGTIHVTLCHLSHKLGPAAGYIRVHRRAGVSFTVPPAVPLL
jgi:DNA-binding response OmpR family regulator